MHRVFLLLTTVLALATGVCHAGEDQEKSGNKPVTPPETALAEAIKDLRRMHIDPDAKKRTVSKVLFPASYFKNQPKTEYWDKGRKAVGTAAFYILTFSEHKQPSVGGGHYYFFDAATHKLLWSAHTK